jgi:hypothetical protein
MRGFDLDIIFYGFKFHLSSLQFSQILLNNLAKSQPSKTSHDYSLSTRVSVFKVQPPQMENNTTNKGGEKSYHNVIIWKNILIKSISKEI